MLNPLWHGGGGYLEFALNPQFTVLISMCLYFHSPFAFKKNMTSDALKIEPTIVVNTTEFGPIFNASYVTIGPFESSS